MGTVSLRRRFLVNKYRLNLNGPSMKEGTIISIRLVKDELCHVGGVRNLK